MPDDDFLMIPDDTLKKICLQISGKFVLMSREFCDFYNFTFLIYVS